MDLVGKITSILDGFDIAALMPDLNSLLDKLDLALRFFVMVGPLAMLGLGLYYFLASPKEANYSAGYRFRYGMSRVTVWRFMQRLAGAVYGCLGLVLMVVMAILCARFGKMSEPDMVWFALKCVVWELELIIAATLAINITVMVRYDRSGNLRKKTREMEE